MEEIYILIALGFLGGLVKEMIEDNQLVLPTITGKTLSLGFIGPCIIGTIAAYLADNDPITAFTAGYAGSSMIKVLVQPKKTSQTTDKTLIKGIIRYVCKQESVDPELALAVAECESSFIPSAINVNTEGSRDRGLFQINDKYHPDVSDSQAFDIVYSTRWFCKAFKEGHLDWWNCSKPCWSKKYDLTKL